MKSKKDFNTIDLYFDDIKEYSLLDCEEENSLFKKVIEGDKLAKEKFLCSNLRLVISIAKNYVNKNMPLEDLIQEGNIGLIKALSKFDPSKGKFSTYATWWIKQSITRAIAKNSRMIRLPNALFIKVNQFKNVKIKLEKELNGNIKMEDIAKAMNTTVNEVIFLDKLSKDVISINNQISDNSDRDYIYYIPADDLSTENEVILKFLRFELLEFIDNLNLSQKDYKLLMLRYGLEDGKPRTLQQISEYLDISIETVRTSEFRILKKIRRSGKIKNFAVYLDFPDKAIKELEKRKEKDIGLKK